MTNPAPNIWGEANKPFKPVKHGNKGINLGYPQKLLELAKIVDLKIKRMFPEHLEPKCFYDPIRYILSLGGKRLRPSLCLLACEIVGGQTETALHTAVAIEMIHNFTLLHDDVMDKAEKRRGKKAAHKIWGEELVINAGDGLFAMAFHTVSKTPVRSAKDAERLVEVIKLLAETVSRIAHGQALDLTLAESSNVTVEQYMEMVRLKTGALFEASLATGAILGGGSEREVKALQRFGEKFGLGFQIRDDLLDLQEDLNKKFGKVFAGDIAMGKRTLMVVHALQKLGGDREKLLQILDKPPDQTTDQDKRFAIKILEENGSINYASRVANRTIEEAKRSIADLEETPAKKTLLELADFAILREF